MIVECVKVVYLIYQLTTQKQNTMESILLSRAITNYINDAQYEFEQGNVAEGKHFLNIIKQLLIDNKDTSIKVTNDYLNSISTFVSNWK